MKFANIFFVGISSDSSPEKLGDQKILGVGDETPRENFKTTPFGS